jgi:excisionase family DNA binding protein
MSKSLLAKAEAALQMTEETLEKQKDTVAQNVEAARKLTQLAADLSAIRELRTEFERLAREAKRPVWYTSTQLAAELSVHEETIRRWYHDGLIRGHRIAEGGFIRFDPFEVSEDIRAKGGEDEG